MKRKFLSENFAKRNVVCNILLILLLLVPVCLALLAVVVIPLFIFDEMRKFFVPMAVIEINSIIALVAAYGFLFKNKTVGFIAGLSTLYSIMYYLFYACAYEIHCTLNDYLFLAFFTFIAWLIILTILFLPLLIRKNGKSALSLLENGGIITKVKIELAVVAFFNLFLIASILIWD